MSSDFDLVISADTPSLTAEFTLRNADGAHSGYKRTEFRSMSAGRLEALFDLRNYLRNRVEWKDQPAALAELGVAIAKDLLGSEIFDQLWNPFSQRTLRILLPAADQAENSLAAALARVPWEVARPTPNLKTLSERNLLLRVVHDMKEPDSEPLELAEDEPLRVLFVFGAARASRPLAARRERRALRKLFESEIYPHRRVVADFLTHGVTRARLEAQIQQHGGYHVVHWSGHGHMNLIELAEPGGAKDLMTGPELLERFADAGGFIPSLFFLGACHSGDITNVRDWESFVKSARGGEPLTKDASAAEPERDALAHEPGYTGTAHALLVGGVSSVVAMRYSVGDEYARDLAIEFYRALLAHNQPKDVAAALTMARNALLKPQAGPARYAPCDHATPILYGAARPDVLPPEGRSPDVGNLGQRLHKVSELTAGEHTHFVGRTWKLAELETQWLGVTAGDDTKPVAVVAGLGGMGKTALAAEALDLWDRRFRWVLLYQAKPEPLPFDPWLHGLDQDFRDRSDRYRDHIRVNPRDSIFLEPGENFKGARRYEQLIDNLVRALKDEPMLVVLDNFETHLKPIPEPAVPGGEPLYACMDPVWDQSLARLAEELVGSGSRVLITCRRPLAALAGKSGHLVRLGPLPPGEAALYLRDHKTLSEMFDAGGAARALAKRLLNASRFHPLLMDRLARLASPQYRQQLEQALAALEKRADFSTLPDLFATTAGADCERESKYLEDALATSNDQLIASASPDARRLLWIIALANEPVTLELLAGVWRGESVKLAAAGASEHKQMPPELRAEVDTVTPVPQRPDPGVLLNQLEAVGLADVQREGPDGWKSEYSCHGLVRERIWLWMEQRPEDRGDFGAVAIRLAYAEWLEQSFHELLHKNMSSALEAGARAVIYCVQAGAYDRLSRLASRVVTSTSDPKLLDHLIPHLEAAASSAPEGKARWTCLTDLADALAHLGHPDKSLPLFEQAATLARAVAEAGGESGRAALADFARILANSASDLRETGDLAAARARRLASAEAYRNAGLPEVLVVGNELEALRIDIIRREVQAALPQASERLAKLQSWWERWRRGEVVPETPDLETLARTLLAALDIVTDAHFALNQWEPALGCINEMLTIKHELNRPPDDIASTRLGRAGPLIELRRFADAKQELDDCLEIFRSHPGERALALFTLAQLYAERGDYREAIAQAHRALALRNTLPDPSYRAISHSNIALYLERSGDAASIAEAGRHRLASLAYRKVADLRQRLQITFHGYVNDFRRARAAGAQPAIPRLVDLLADPAFDALARWLRERKVDLDELQAHIGQFLAAARADAEHPEEEPP